MTEPLPERPRNIEEYKRWLEVNHGLRLTEAHANHYSSVARKVSTDLPKTPFWEALLGSLRQWGSEYSARTSFPLWGAPPEIKLDLKSFDSFISKTFRKNILVNEEWPNPPASGWLLPPVWFTQVRDVVRSYVVAKYLDGVSFLVDHVSDLAREFDVGFDSQFEAKDEGYYAAHIYIQDRFEIPTMEWATERRALWVELQVTTQLQEVIRKLTHRHYAATREAVNVPDMKWQWDYRSDRFTANYLGHILHYVEGMIMEVRQQEERFS